MKKPEEDFDLFSQEEAIIARLDAFLASEPFEDPVIESVFIDLYKNYKKLYKNTRRLVKMSDKRELEMNALNAELKGKNGLLESLSSKLSKYLSPQVYEHIFSGKQDSTLAAERKKLTVFFSDIANFTEISDRLEAEDLVARLNGYLTQMTRIALGHGATIDKYIGDAVMLFFGDPTTQGVQNDALAAILMALEMRRFLQAEQAASSERGVGFQAFDVRMGINTGYCTVGNFGSEEKMDYTIIGKEVNIASRLQSHAEPGEILISHETYVLVKDAIACEPKGLISLKGISEPVRVYRVNDTYENLRSGETLIQHSEEGFSLFLDTARLAHEQKARTAQLLEDLLKTLKPA